jgi:hypothetical protein
MRRIFSNAISITGVLFVLLTTTNLSFGQMFDPNDPNVTRRKAIWQACIEGAESIVNSTKDEISTDDLGYLKQRLVFAVYYKGLDGRQCLVLPDQNKIKRIGSAYNKENPEAIYIVVFSDEEIREHLEEQALFVISSDSLSRVIFVKDAEITPLTCGILLFHEVRSFRLMEKEIKRGPMALMDRKSYWSSQRESADQKNTLLAKVGGEPYESWLRSINFRLPEGVTEIPMIVQEKDLSPEAERFFGKPASDEDNDVWNEMINQHVAFLAINRLHPESAVTRNKAKEDILKARLARKLQKGTPKKAQRSL